MALIPGVIVASAALAISSGPAPQPFSGNITVQQRGPATYSAPVLKTFAAGQSQQLIGANATRRALAIVPVPGSGSATCTIDPSGGAASASSMPIPSGWNWTETDPPPAGSVSAYCPSPETLSIMEAN